MLKQICLDMDGTLADLYSVPNWLEKLRAYDASPYVFAQPMCDTDELADLLAIAQHRGIEIRIITWLSKDTNEQYDELVRIAKRAWLDAYHIPYDHFHGIAYGATKANSVRRSLDRQSGETAILFDDNAKVRKGWTLGDAYDPTQYDICGILREVLGLEVAE